MDRWIDGWQATKYWWRKAVMEWRAGWFGSPCNECKSDSRRNLLWLFVLVYDMAHWVHVIRFWLNWIDESEAWSGMGRGQERRDALVIGSRSWDNGEVCAFGWSGTRGKRVRRKSFCRLRYPFAVRVDEVSKNWTQHCSAHESLTAHDSVMINKTR